ncbi:MAG: substrate-binding domain-containing protein [Pseudomonadota bacterium]|nr:substrate-binding domain-containing protein [Pseudomonadota bacterium]
MTTLIRKRTALWALLAGGALGLCNVAVAQTQAEAPFITMASTTSTEQSGLFGYLLPIFKKVSGIDVRVIAVGTGQALDIGRRGDADIVFVHNKTAEEKFLGEGHAKDRKDVMYNDFVLVGPASDPAHVAGKDIAVALKKLAASGSPFISRGDRSGTNAAELRLWKKADIDIAANKPAGYRECGCGMGQALNQGSSTEGYVLTDRGTWLSFKNRGDLKILVEGDKSLFNQYGVMVIDPAKHPGVKVEQAQAFADWITSKDGQDAIDGYKIDGQQLFFPNAAR